MNKLVDNEKWGKTIFDQINLNSEKKIFDQINRHCIILGKITLNSDKYFFDKIFKAPAILFEHAPSLIRPVSTVWLPKKQNEHFLVILSVLRKK